MKRFGFILLYLGLAACGGSSNNNVGGTPPGPDRLGLAAQRVCGEGVSDPGIIGGKKLGSNSRIASGVVVLLDKENQYLCSGTLVAKNVVLTAAHCLNKNKDTSQILVGFTTDILCDWGQKNYSRFAYGSAKVIHPLYQGLTQDPHSIGYDFGLLKLDRDAPWFANPLPVEMNQVRWAYEPSIYVAGSGVTLSGGVQDDSDPMLRIVQVQPALIKQAEWDVEASSKGLYKELVYFDESHGSGACSGDSGGPALVKRASGYAVAGVASFVSGKCAGEIAYSELYSLKQWLKESFSNFSNYPNPF
jgi:secreted trypsin-like serine protease